MILMTLRTQQNLLVHRKNQQREASGSEDLNGRLSQKRDGCLMDRHRGQVSSSPADKKHVGSESFLQFFFRLPVSSCIPLFLRDGGGRIPAADDPAKHTAAKEDRGTESTEVLSSSPARKCFLLTAHEWERPDCTGSVRLGSPVLSGW